MNLKNKSSYIVKMCDIFDFICTFQTIIVERQSQCTLGNNCSFLYCLDSCVDVPVSDTHKVKFPCILCKGDHLLKDCPGISLVLEVCSKHHVSSVFDHHANDAPLTRESLVKSRKGKVRYPCFLCKDMHRTYLCPHMHEASKLLEYITVTQ